MGTAVVTNAGTCNCVLDIGEIPLEHTWGYWRWDDAQEGMGLG